MGWTWTTTSVKVSLLGLDDSRAFNYMVPIGIDVGVVAVEFITGTANPIFLNFMYNFRVFTMGLAELGG